MMTWAMKLLVALDVWLNGCHERRSPDGDGPRVETGKRDAHEMSQVAGGRAESAGRPGSQEGRCGSTDSHAGTPIDAAAATSQRNDVKSGVAQRDQHVTEVDVHGEKRRTDDRSYDAQAPVVGSEPADALPLAPPRAEAPPRFCATCNSWRHTMPCGRDDCPETDATVAARPTYYKAYQCSAGWYVKAEDYDVLLRERDEALEYVAGQAERAEAAEARTADLITALRTLAELKADYDAAADKFIAKVQDGRARSHETYADLRACRAESKQLNAKLAALLPPAGDK